MSEMKEEAIGELTPAQLVEKLNAGGWFRFHPLSFSTCGCRGSFWPTEKAELVDDVLTIGNITVKQPSMVWLQQDQILVKEPYIRREQKKKVDGGGWREIPSIRIVLRLVNENFVHLARKESAFRKEQERQKNAERERMEVVRKVAEAKKKEEEEQARLARGVQFLNALNEHYQGKKLAIESPIQTEEQTLVLKFEDGDILRVVLFDASDYYPSHLIVNEISTESFMAESPNRY